MATFAQELCQMTNDEVLQLAEKLEKGYWPDWAGQSVDNKYAGGFGFMCQIRLELEQTIKGLEAQNKRLQTQIEDLQEELQVVNGMEC